MNDKKKVPTARTAVPVPLIKTYDHYTLIKTVFIVLGTRVDLQIREVHLCLEHFSTESSKRSAGAVLASQVVFFTSIC